MALIDAAFGAFENFETTLYFSGVALTSLGYCLQAANGLMIFGISTASFITGVQHAIKKWTEAHRDSAGLIRGFANLELCA